jgi:vitamin B12 transporter
MIRRFSAYIILAPVRVMAVKFAMMLWSLMGSGVAASQGMVMEDTVNISAVTVTAASPERLLPYTVFVIERKSMNNNENTDLARVLHNASLVSVKRYGNYGLATVSIRGLPGSHTQVLWNGLAVNAVSNGYSDFAIIPLNSAVSVRITSGGSDLNDITGSTGGKIDLSSELPFQRTIEGSLSVSAASYNSYSASAVIRAGSDAVAAKIDIWGGKARNDFLFVNSNSPGGSTVERRTNASAASEGLSADLGFLSGRSSLSAHFWYNNANRQLPGPVTTVQQDYDERQSDRSLRGVVKYVLDPGRLKISVSAGGSHETNLYFNESPDLNGNNISTLLMIKSRVSYKPGDRAELVMNAGNEYQRAQTLNYSEIHDRNVFSASLAARYNPVTRLRLTVQARQMAIAGVTVSPEFAAGAVYMLTGNGEHLLKVSLSHNIKLPCLNDLYWLPGGNGSLKPEQADKGELSYSYAGLTSSGLKNTVTLVIHASRINDMIQWIPGDGGIWSAQNVRSINVTGMESMIRSEVPLNDWDLSGYINYALTRSVIADSEIPNDRSTGSQLIYVPLHHLNINVRASWKQIVAQMTAVYESKRYTTSDNSEWLPSSFLADGSLGTVIRKGRTRARIDLNVHNIFNTRLESVRNYPMPLRTYNMRMTITFINLPVTK